MLPGKKNLCIGLRCSKWYKMLHCGVKIIAFQSKVVTFFIYRIAGQNTRNLDKREKQPNLALPRAIGDSWQSSG